MRQFLPIILLLGQSSATPFGLGPFSIITFQNKECRGTGTDGVIGTCISSTECSDRSGTDIGNCASGFGKCCVVRKAECTSTVSINGSYIANPEFPAVADTATAYACTYTIDVANRGICQVRLDFQDVNLTPGGNGDFTVSSLATTPTGPPPQVSGTLTGQHMYLDVTGNTNPTVTLTKPAGTPNDKWDIRVTQIECDSPFRPPRGCTQYFTELMGTIASYNSDCGSAVYALATNAELNNQNMKICIRQAPGYSQVTYNAGTNFFVGDRLAANAAVIGGFAGDNTLVAFGCRATGAGNSMAQLIIPNNSASGNDIFCRNRLAPGNTPGALNTAPNVNAPIIQDSPFSVTHLTGAHARMESTGFCLNYNQSA